MGRMRDLGLAVTQLIARKQLYAWLLAASAVLDAQGDALGPFNTIVAGAQNSGRLVDVSLETVQALENGALCWVLSVKDWFRWNPTYTGSVDNITVCKPTALGGSAGAFIRECIPAPEWTAHPTFTAVFWDPNNGSDEGLGDAGHPLKTDAERNRRWGPGAMLSAGAWSITAVSSNSASDPFVLDVVLGHGATLTINGTPTIAATGTVTAFSAANRGAETMAAVTDAAQTWTSQVQRWATITGGARAGAYFCVAKDLGSHQCRASTPETFNPATGLATRVALQVGDPYTVTTVPSLIVGEFNVRQAEGTALGAYVLLADILLDCASSAIIRTFGPAVFATRATLKNSFIESDFFSPCGIAFQGNNSFYPPTVATYMMGGVNFGFIQIQSGAIVYLDLDFLLQGTGAGSFGKLFVTPGGVAQIGTLAAFDVQNEAITVQAGGNIVSATVQDGADLIWGDANVGHAVNVKARGGLVYTTKPTVNTLQGTGRMSLVGGINKDWANIPFMNGYDGVTVGTGNGAAIVLNQ